MIYIIRFPCKRSFFSDKLFSRYYSSSRCFSLAFKNIFKETHASFYTTDSIWERRVLFNKKNRKKKSTLSRKSYIWNDARYIYINCSRIKHINIYIYICMYPCIHVPTLTWYHARLRNADLAPATWVSARVMRCIHVRQAFRPIPPSVARRPRW